MGNHQMLELSKTSEKEESSFAEMERILSSLANQDALKIFRKARDGIVSSTKIIKELGLTQKRYYTRLNELMNAGLIEKNEDAYQHTILGKLCYNLGEVFEKALSQRDRLDLLGKLKRANTLTLEETKTIAQALSAGGASGLPEMESLVSSVRMVDNYEQLVQETVKLLEKAEKEVYLATQYFDFRVTETFLRIMKRNIKYNVLYDERNPGEKLQTVLRMLLAHPTMLKTFIEVMKSPDFKVRLAQLPYAFLVVDSKYAMIEIAKPYTGAFFIAFILENEKLSEKFIETFKILWNKGTEIGSLMDTFLGEGQKKLKIPYVRAKS